MYTKPEIIKILSPYKDRSPIIVKLMDEMSTKKLVPAGRTQLFVLLKDHEEGKQIIDNDWNSCGQPRSFKDKDIRKMSDALEEESGQTIGTNELISIIKETRSKNIEAIDIFPISATKNPAKPSLYLASQPRYLNLPESYPTHLC